MAYKSTYTTDSDADDEFERPGYVTTTMPSEVSPTESDGITSAEHTPTTFTRSHSDGSHDSPRGLITDWTAAQCAEYFKSLGLSQYTEGILEEAINGEALVEMQHQDLKDMGIASVGHRLRVLKGVYDIKVKQNIPLDPDHYVPPSADAATNEMMATQEDIGRIIDSIRLRDQRIIAAESELRAMKEDVNRLLEENRKLREETLPLVRAAKDRSHPLPNPEHALTTPPADLKMDKLGTGLSRKFSTKKLFLGSAPKNLSPTMAGGQALQDGATLDPSAAAVAASNHLTATMSSQPSPNTVQQFSPTSPAYSVTAPSTRHFPRQNTEPSGAPARGDNYTHYNTRPDTATSAAPTSGGNAEGASSSSRREGSRSKGVDPGDIFKSFRVSIEDPCHKVLPVALKRYQINDDWRQYALYIVHGDQERCLGLEEKPLMLFKQLDREGRKPMFMLRKHASPAGEGWSGPGQGTAVGGSVPGGVL